MLEQVYADIRRHYARDELVLGEGRHNARIMLVGEAPGKDEVREGRPFCGKAGRNLDEFLQAIQLPREELFISNVVKFRPTKVSEKGSVSNRPPTRREVEEAIPFLYREVQAVAPRCIVSLGNTPLRALLGDFTAVIGGCHGSVQPVHILGAEYPLFALYHPASIIYNRALRPVYEQDLHKLSGYIHTLPAPGGN